MEETKFSYLYILDYLCPGIYEIKLTEEDNDLNTEEILKKYDLKVDNCSYMYSMDKLELLTLEI